MNVTSVATRLRSASAGERQRGAVLLLVTFSLIVLFAMAALALDLSRMYIVKSQLQDAADAGALRGAMLLNGTKGAEGLARSEAIAAAKANGLLAAEGLSADSDIVVEFAKRPDSAAWSLNIPDPYDYYYVRVTTSKTDIKSLFAGMLGIWSNGAVAVAIAGRGPSGAVLPLFVPVVRRNSDQITGLVPSCNGQMYDEGDAKGLCPDDASFASLPPDKRPIYRGPDPSGNWGFLIPGQSFADVFASKNGGASPPADYDYLGVDKKTGNPIPPDVGSYYSVAPKPNAPQTWTPGTGWTGNYGWVLADPTNPGQVNKRVQEALCTGIQRAVYTAPGCAEVKTGVGPYGSFGDALNTRFDVYPKNYDWTPAQCPPDSNIFRYAAPVPPVPSAYDQYKVGTGAVAPSHLGAAGRRVFRIWVIDNAWNQGYLDAINNTCRPSLTGGSQDAHIVGCAEFFMWKAADNQGLIYSEFIRRVPDSECSLGSNPQTYAQVRLFR